MNRRTANMELLRILAMVFIVSIHYVTFNQIISNTNVAENEFIAHLIYAVTYCCVDVFVLISGWFYKTQKKEISIVKSVEKIVYLWLKTMFYSISIMVIYSAIIKKMPSKNTLVESFIPITCKAYWFLSAYVFLLFVIPFIDKLINNLNKREHGLGVILIIVLISIPSTFLPNNWLLDTEEGLSFLWFACLYFIGAYLRRISDKIKISKYAFLIGYFVSVASFIVFFYATKYLSTKVGIFEISSRVFRYTSIPTLASAICLVFFFAKVNIKTEKLTKIICAISSVTFDVYIIHCYELMDKNLYSNILKGKDYINSPYMILHFVVCVLIIYIGCTVIGLIRAKLLDKPFKAVAHFAGEKISILENKIFRNDSLS